MKRSFSFISCLIITLLVIWSKQQVIVTTAQPLPSTPTQDFAILLDQSRPLLKQSTINPNVIAKISTTYTPYTDLSDLKDQGAIICEQFKLPAGMLTEEEGHPTYTCSQKYDDQMEVTLKLVGLSDNSTYLLVKGTAAHAEGIQTLLDWTKQSELSMHSHNLAAKWNFLVKGLQIQDPTSASALLEQVNNQFQATEVERYAEDRTIVVSYDTKLLNDAVSSGGHTVKLQVSMHLNSETDKWSITLGTPMITGEF
ncbi:YwmB family TATA-box binding protein [Paenibacillus sp. KN14-4R]|uniref:YwmB family TATA-box binding protein n=1 Tax=Paenibacillus sp. KN14-4R TaxID=3445773 RepID=UPI003F9F4F1C